MQWAVSSTCVLIWYLNKKKSLCPVLPPLSLSLSRHFSPLFSLRARRAPRSASRGLPASDRREAEAWRPAGGPSLMLAAQPHGETRQQLTGDTAPRSGQHRRQEGGFYFANSPLPGKTIVAWKLRSGEAQSQRVPKMGSGNHRGGPAEGRGRMGWSQSSVNEPKFHTALCNLT